ncbi:MAG: hypothetical protein V2A69_02705 [Pseudomonadota bacterium]
MGVFISFLILTGNLLSAQENGPPAEAIRGAYRQILASADKNGDRKLSMAECMSISSNKSKVEKDCRYWDANDLYGNATGTFSILSLSRWLRYGKKMELGHANPD